MAPLPDTGVDDDSEIEETSELLIGLDHGHGFSNDRDDNASDDAGEIADNLTEAEDIFASNIPQADDAIDHLSQ